MKTPVFPQYWPVLSLCGGGPKRRDALLLEVQEELITRDIRCLVVHDCRDKKSLPSQVLSLSGHKDVLVCTNDFRARVAETNNSYDVLESVAPYVHRYDIIIIDTEVALPSIETVYLSDGSEGPVEKVSKNIFSFCPRDGIYQLVDFLQSWMQQKISMTPVWACVLIGGKSRRMGRPKHLLKGDDGQTWLENTVKKLQQVSAQIVLSGNGDIPLSLQHLPRMVDIHDLQGPVTGILSAMRWNPLVSWLLVACDMPDIKEEGMQWLLSKRKPGVWGVVPRHLQSKYFEPLLAYYDFRSINLFEKLHSRKCKRIGRIYEDSKIATPNIPEELAHCWRNCNTPDDLKEG